LRARLLECPQQLKDGVDAKQLAKSFGFHALTVPLAVIDAAGFFIVGTGQMLSTLYAISPLNGQYFIKHKYLAAVIFPFPFIAAIGVMSLNITENRKLLRDWCEARKPHVVVDEERSKKIRKQLAKYCCNNGLGELAKEHPVEVGSILLAAVVEGVIVFANAGYTLNQFGPRMLNTGWLSLGLFTSIATFSQFTALSGKEVIDLIREGSDVAEYVSPEAFVLRRWLNRVIVNGLPLLSCLTHACLGMAETFQLIQSVIEAIEPEHKLIADRTAWMFVFALSLLYGTARWALYGRRYKSAAADMMRELNYELEKELKLVWVILRFGRCLKSGRLIYS